ncbi:eukaryotic rRNA processing protein EBP2-domain-containing protein [Globomyces pollinis-pini]|nr:eukaryotic rRNA processing protein EBP2-domain-containing protein [Globomyces pollinis-pini]
MAKGQKRKQNTKSKPKEKKEFDMTEFLQQENITLDAEVENLMTEGNVENQIISQSTLTKKSKKRDLKPLPEPEVEPEEEMNSDDEKEFQLYLEMMKKSKNDDDEEKVDDDEELEVKVYKNVTTALLSRLQDIRLSKELPFIETLAHTNTIVTSGNIPDVNDDLKRELAFYEQALESCKVARNLITQAGIPFSRPDDYFAEMIKTDDHMEKVRQKLIEQSQSIKLSEQAKKQRDLKKFGKKVQVEKLLERQKSKKDALEKIKGIRKKGITESDDFDVQTVETNSSTRKTDRPNHKRKSKDQKYGFGGGKKHAKTNDKKSVDDLSSFSIKKMKGNNKVGKRSATGKGRGRGRK